MRRPSLIVSLLLIAVAFAAGWFARDRVGSTGSKEREVLYWVDPMNPSFRSPESGVAPCGMPLEPVYAGQSTPDASGVDGRTIEIPADRRQLVGIVVETVEPGVVEGNLRLPGRVIADERRAHLVVPLAEGKVEALGPATVGSLVREGEFLLSMSSNATENAQWNYLQALDKLDEVKRNQPAGSQLDYQKRLVSTLSRTLLNYGLTAEEIQKIERTRQPMATIEMRSPASGYVLSQDAVLGEEFNTATTLYVVADIEQIFVFADVLYEDIELLADRPEATIRIPGRPHRFEARARPGPHEFDAALGGLRIRFEVHNPDLLLLPEMFVDVDLPIRTAEAISVPVNAVIDNGRSRRVYVDLGQGRFEPREVDTGWRLGGRVQILSGLEAGDVVVVSGNFLLDSESRMRVAGDWPADVGFKDPVCGMTVDEAAARDARRVSVLDGTEFLFCCDACKERFDAEPEAFLSAAASRD